MNKKIIGCLLLTGISLFASAQKKVGLVNDAYAIIAYSLTKKEIRFYVKTNGGSPELRIDVNKNGVIDNMVDRSYGIASGDGLVICKQFLIDERTSTHCSGAPSQAKLSGERFDYVFTIPVRELITPINEEQVHVQFQIAVNESGAWKFYRYPYSLNLFGSVYKIDLK